MTVYSARRIVRESAPLLSGLVLFQVAAGQVLHSQAGALFAAPVLLALIPALNGVGGNVGSVLGARLASGLHLGTIAPEATDRELLDNVAAALVVALATFTFIAVAVEAAGLLLGIAFGIGAVELALLVVASGALLTVSLIIISVATALYSYRTGRDPDNTVIPVVTSLGDLLGVAWLFIVYRVVIA